MFDNYLLKIFLNIYEYLKNKNMQKCKYYIYIKVYKNVNVKYMYIRIYFLCIKNHAYQ